MRKHLTAALGAALVVAVSVVGCLDQSSPLAPASGAAARAIPPDSPLLDKRDAVQKRLYPLRRATPVPDGTRWSFVASPTGAVNRNAAAGLTIIVPAGAVAANTTITVTTVGGDLVAYRFEPHGVHFRVPLVFVQDLDASVNGEGPITGAYFPGPAPQIDPRSHLLSVPEVEPTFTNLRAHGATMLVSHFSGYIFASGEKDD